QGCGHRPGTGVGRAARSSPDPGQRSRPRLGRDGDDRRHAPEPALRRGAPLPGSAPEMGHGVRFRGRGRLPGLGRVRLHDRRRVDPGWRLFGFLTVEIGPGWGKDGSKDGGEVSILKTLEATAADLKSQMGPVADRMKDTADDLMEKIGTESRHFGEMMGERLAAQLEQVPDEALKRVHLVTARKSRRKMVLGLLLGLVIGAIIMAAIDR